MGSRLPILAAQFLNWVNDRECVPKLNSRTTAPNHQYRVSEWNIPGRHLVLTMWDQFRGT
jgi:hypothetical protein